ncbi:arginine N-succinyltransferase [Novosphingobium sp. B 225]|uniref:arginine N-succinyltransferase n=1 Tax=Novosphingobium sp. B 225 TaxID=1961849 RepID=UPI000B4BBB04|nr:arginine N-succinyltransferase [Novosphingobium sp. B 225]
MTFVIRAARETDLQHLYEMAKRTGGGFTNLPPDRKALMAKLERSAAGFARAGDDVGDDLFVFMLENTATGEVRGTCQVFSAVGLKWPFYSYRIGALTQHSAELERTFRADILNLSTDLEGASEVGGLFLHPGERAGGLGLLIARSRYMFIRNHRARFADRCLAELRGVIDEAGGSPFWDGVAGRFFGMNFQDADEFNARFGNQFIADLMPKHPVYIAMLTEHARAVIGVPHPTGRAAMRMLEEEGFAWENYIDIFDGGPTMTARTDQIRSVREAADDVVRGVDAGLGEHQAGEKRLIACGRLADFRCAYGWIAPSGDGIVIDPECARTLEVEPGETVTHVARW